MIHFIFIVCLLDRLCIQLPLLLPGMIGTPNNPGPTSAENQALHVIISFGPYSAVRYTMHQFILLGYIVREIFASRRHGTRLRIATGRNGKLAALQETAEAAAAPAEHQALLTHTAEQAFFGGPNRKTPQERGTKTAAFQWVSEGGSTGSPSGRLFRTGVTPPQPAVRSILAGLLDFLCGVPRN